MSAVTADRALTPTHRFFRWMGVVTVVTAALALSGPAVAAVRPSAAGVLLRGETVISSRGTAVGTVHLAASMTIANPSKPQITVSDPARLAAVVLVSTAWFPFPPALVVSAMPTGGGDVQYIYGWMGDVRPGDVASPIYLHPVFPAGTYRLYVVASGPERITWTLPTTRGTTKVLLTRSAIADTVAGTGPGVPGVAVSNYVQGYGQFTMPGRSLLYSFSWVAGPDIYVTSATGCVYQGSTVATATEPLGPACPGGLAAGVTQVGPQGSYSTSQGESDVAAPGVYGQKVWVVAGPVIQRSAYRLLFVAFG